MKQARVVCVTPCRQAGDVSVGMAAWLTNSVANDLIKRWIPKESYSCAYGRNEAVAEALKMEPKPTHIMFVDSDVVPQLDAVQRLISHDKPIVAGWTFQIQPVSPQDPTLVIRACVSVGERDGRYFMYPSELPNELFAVKFFGGACFMVKAEVFERLPWPWFKMVFAKVGILVPEDFAFCELAKAHGYELFCDPAVRCQHYHVLDIERMSEAAVNTLRTEPQPANHEVWLDDDDLDAIKDMARKEQNEGLMG